MKDVQCLLLAALLTAGSAGCAASSKGEGGGARGPAAEGSQDSSAAGFRSAGSRPAGEPLPANAGDAAPVGPGEGAPDGAPDPETADSSGTAARSDRTGASSDSETLGAEIMREAPVGDRVLARVDEREIRASDVYRDCFLDNPMKVMGFLENLVLYELVGRESERLGIRVDSREVEKVIDWMFEDKQGEIALKIDESMTLEAFVEQSYGMDMKGFRDLMRRSAVYQLLLERCLRYSELRVRRLRLGVIVLDELPEAAGIYRKLLKGANFESLAKEHSQDPSSAAGGILPPLPADLDDPFVRSALKLKEGDITEVEEVYLKKKKMYAVIRLQEIIEPLEGSYASLKSRVEESLDTDPLVPVIIPYWIQSLRGRYKLQYSVP